MGFFWPVLGPGTLFLSSWSPWDPDPSPKFRFWLIFGPKRATPVLLDIIMMFVSGKSLSGMLRVATGASSMLGCATLASSILGCAIMDIVDIADAVGDVTNVDTAGEAGGLHIIPKALKLLSLKP